MIRPALNAGGENDAGDRSGKERGPPGENQRTKAPPSRLLFSGLRVGGSCHDGNYWDGNGERVVLPAHAIEMGTSRSPSRILPCEVANATKRGPPFTRTSADRTVPADGTVSVVSLVRGSIT